MSDTGRPGPNGSWEPPARPTWAPRDPGASGPPAPAGPPTPSGAPGPAGRPAGAQPPAPVRPPAPAGRPAAPPVAPAGPAHAVQRPVGPPPGPAPQQPTAQQRPTAQQAPAAQQPAAHQPNTQQRPAAHQPTAQQRPATHPAPVPPPGRSAAASPFPAAGDGSGAPGASSDAPPAHAAGDRRPRWLLPVAVGAGVLVVGGVVAGVLLTRGDGDVAPTGTATTVVLPSPTPTVAPVPRTATTAFASALPISVLDYALATSAPDDERVAAGALEAWTETYTDGADGTLTVRAAQFETPEEAAAFATALVAGLPAAPAGEPAATGAATPGADGAPALPQQGEVQAGGAAAGTYTIVDAGDGTGVAVWQNGTAVLQLTAPVADVADAYAAFPL